VPEIGPKSFGVFENARQTQDTQNVCAVTKGGIVLKAHARKKYKATFAKKLEGFDTWANFKVAKIKRLTLH